MITIIIEMYWKGQRRLNSLVHYDPKKKKKEVIVDGYQWTNIILKTGK